MSGFKALKDVSKNFDDELRRVSNELFSAKITETFEDSIAKKLCDLSLYTSKLKLLRAKAVSLTQQPQEEVRDKESTLKDYGETVAQRIIERQLVKSATQGQAVRRIITAPDSTLDPEMVERKEKIISALTAYTTQESTVQQLDTVLNEKEDQLQEVQKEWDREVACLRDMRGQDGDEVDENDPNFKKLQLIVNKLELMRWLTCRLGAPRSRGYDWLSDPHRRLRAIKNARTPHTVQGFLHDS